jgi:hypothetical protein
VLARAVQADAARTHALFAWITMRDCPAYPGAFVCRLVTCVPTLRSLSLSCQNLWKFLKSSGRFQNVSVSVNQGVVRIRQ